MHKDDILQGKDGIYQILQEPYFDEDLKGQLCLKAKANELTDNQPVMLYWPIKNASYDSYKFRVEPPEY